MKKFKTKKQDKAVCTGTKRTVNTCCSNSCVSSLNMITLTLITGSVYLFYTLDTTDVNMRCQFGRKWFLKSCRAKYNIRRERDIVLEMYVI